MVAIALGNPLARDDGAALAAAEALDGEPSVDVIRAGRPGPGLLELLEPPVPTLLLDVVRRGVAPGSMVDLRLHALLSHAAPGLAVSSHGFGAASALRLGAALGRELPPGRFLGIGGADFAPGEGLSPDVARGLGAFVDAARRALAELRSGESC
ncbi:MAG: hydrogenase maturation protease [Sandaracinaceae bacterium]